MFISRLWAAGCLVSGVSGAKVTVFSQLCLGPPVVGTTEMFLMALKAPGEEEVGQNRPTPYWGGGVCVPPSICSVPGPLPASLCFPWASVYGNAGEHLLERSPAPWEGAEQM